MATEGQAMTPGQVRDQMRARPGFASKTAKTLGITQLTCGIVLLVFGFAVLFAPTTVRGQRISFYGSPILCGVMFIIPGAFGIQSSKSKSNFTIIRTMVMSILAAAIFVPLMLGLVSLDLAIYTSRQCYNYNTKERHTRCGSDAGVALNAILLCAALVELVAAICHASVCCRAVCSCCKPQNGTANTGTVHYVQNGEQVIIMTSTGPQQVVATATNTGQTIYVEQAPAAVNMPPGQYGAPKPQYPVHYGAPPVAAPATCMVAPAGGQNPGSYSMPQASSAPQNPEYTTLSQSGGAKPPEYSTILQQRQTVPPMPQKS